LKFNKAQSRMAKHKKNFPTYLKMVHFRSIIQPTEFLFPKAIPAKYFDRIHSVQSPFPNT